MFGSPDVVWGGVGREYDALLSGARVGEGWSPWRASVVRTSKPGRSDPWRPPPQLERRLRRLERTNRVLVAALGLGVVMALMSAVRGPQTTELLQVKRVQLVDDEGRVRIDLRHNDDETGLFIMDEAGDTRRHPNGEVPGGGATIAHGGERER